MRNIPGYTIDRAVLPRQNQVQSESLTKGYVDNPVFSNIEADIYHKREAQAVRWSRIYSLSGTIAGQATVPEIITIDQEQDFYCKYISASAYSYDAVNASIFPVPNSAGLVHWAMRGLTVEITETSSGRQITSGELPFELFATPGYGTAFQNLFPLPYYFYRNNKIRFVIRNRETNTSRTHRYEIALVGVNYLAPADREQQSPNGI